MSEKLLEIENMTTEYETKDGNITAVDDISFDVEKNKNMGVIGESGCGKSTAARSILRILDDNGQVTKGNVRYKGTDLLDMKISEFNNKIRWKEISFIPQQSLNALDPLRRIDSQFIELITTHENISSKRARNRARDLFDTVGLDPDRINDYPHQFSGGMRQRAMIAMALSLNPSLIIADEPTTALDILMQEKVFAALEAAQEEFDVTLTLITHDVAVVNENCKHVNVMYAGRLVESGTAEQVYANPYHPYSMGLSNAFPSVRKADKDLVSIPGTPPELQGDGSECLFSARCPFSDGKCKEEEPSHSTPEDGHMMKCHYPERQEEFLNHAANPETWRKR